MNDPQPLKIQNLASLLEVRTGLESALETVKTMACDTAEQKKIFYGFGKQLAENKKTLEAWRQKETEQARAVVARYQQACKPVENLIDNLTSAIKNKINAFDRAELLARAKAAAQRQPAAPLGPASEDRGISPAGPAHVTPELKKRNTVDFEIIDIAKIPLQYLTPDAVKIRQDLRAGILISGIRKILKEGLGF